MIILISGKQGSGKTTLARALIKKINEQPGVYAQNMTFAEPLYTFHDFIWGYLQDHGIEKKHVKDGYLLQLLGTEWGRDKVDPFIWAKLLKARVEKHKNTQGKLYSKTYYIVSDCRFKNEFDAFGTDGVMTVRLYCNKDVRMKRAEMWRETDNHPSETDLDIYAEAGQFDCYYNTEVESVDSIVENVLLWANQKEKITQLNKELKREHAASPTT